VKKTKKDDQIIVLNQLGSAAVPDQELEIELKRLGGAHIGSVSVPGSLLGHEVGVRTGKRIRRKNGDTNKTKE
jgi:hypothetical protein